MNPSESVLYPVFKASALSAGPRSIDERGTKSRIGFEPRESPALGSRDEVLVVDERSRLRPAQVIEAKLYRLFRNSSLPVTFLLGRRIVRTR